MMLALQYVFLPCVFRCLHASIIVRVICQCLRVYFIGDIFKEWFGASERERFPSDAFLQLP